MKVFEVMTCETTACRASDSLQRLADLMWRSGCGAVPVLDEGRRPVGIITDRDAFMALSVLGRTPEDIQVGEVMSVGLVTCRMDDDLDVVTRSMADRHVRRLPVLDNEGRLAGILSTSDLLVRASRAVADLYVELAAGAPRVRPETDHDDQITTAA